MAVAVDTPFVPTVCRGRHSHIFASYIQKNRHKILWSLTQVNNDGPLFGFSREIPEGDTKMTNSAEGRFDCHLRRFCNLYAIGHTRYCGRLPRLTGAMEPSQPCGLINGSSR